VGPAQVRAVGEQGGHVSIEVGDRRGAAQGGPVRRQRRAGAWHDAAAEQDLRGPDAQDQRRVAAGPVRAFPEREVQMRLVRRLFAGEAQVVGDPEQAAADPRLGAQPGRHPLPQLRSQGGDECLRRLE
jgi:hypothetical protein